MGVAWKPQYWVANKNLYAYYLIWRCLYNWYNVILVEILDVVRITHAIKTTSYHVVNAIIHFPTTRMHALQKINMDLRWYRWPFFWCLAHGLYVLNTNYRGIHIRQMMGQISLAGKHGWHKAQQFSLKQAYIYFWYIVDVLSWVHSKLNSIACKSDCYKLKLDRCQLPRGGDKR